MNAATPIRFDESLVQRYGVRGPRYTSYPTAVQFDAKFDADAYLAAVTRSNRAGQPMSLYVHVPFCRQLCYYCGCNKVVTRNQQRVQRYLECLHCEITMKSALFDDSRTVEQLHFGGGTPTYLDAQQLQAVMRDLQNHFQFAREDDRQFSIEIDPRTMNRNRIQHLAALGFNRLSLGIQDFDIGVQRAVNRLQSVEEIEVLVDESRKNGFNSISFDLIYGLPLQNTSSFRSTLEQSIALRPDRLAIYNYAHLPHRFKGQRMIADTDIPPPEVRLEILHTTIDYLQQAGYVYVGMDHFALPNDDLVTARTDGTLQRNFQGYSTHGHCDLIGLGVSAISKIDDAYAQTIHTTALYEAALENKQLPIAKGITLSKDDTVRANVIESLMCYDGVSFDAIEAAHNIDFADYFSKELGQLAAQEADGLVERSARGISVTDKGRLLVRSVAMLFDRYLQVQVADPIYSAAI